MDINTTSGAVGDCQHAAPSMSHTGQGTRENQAIPGPLSEPEQHPAHLLSCPQPCPAHATQPLPASCAAGHHTKSRWPCLRPLPLPHFAFALIVRCRKWVRKSQEELPCCSPPCWGCAPPAGGDTRLVATVAPACQHCCLQWTQDAHRHIPVPGADSLSGLGGAEMCFSIALKEKLRHRAGKQLTQSQQPQQEENMLAQPCLPVDGC